jgi:hypothetical protein
MTDARPPSGDRQAWWQRVAPVERDTAAARATYDRLLPAVNVASVATRATGRR